MKRFKLKKDLPGFPAGTILCTKDDEASNVHDLYLESTNMLSGYKVNYPAIYTDTGIGIDAISNWLEELPEEFSRRVDENCKFFSLRLSGEITEFIDCGDLISNSAFAIGNYFKTKDEARAYGDYLRALAVVRDDAKGFKPNWEDSYEIKYSVHFNHDEMMLRPFCITNGWGTQDHSVFGIPYFRTEDDAVASVMIHRKEWETIFGINNENEGDDEQI